MGSDASEEQDSATNALPIRVHLSMCSQLLELVDRILDIIPSIEEAQPGSSGIQALCQLHNATKRARELVRYCCTSKLYLAVTGEKVKSRFERTKTILDQGLSQLRTMVPVALAIEISKILFDLRATQFLFYSHEELAGKALCGILQKEEPVDSSGDSEIALLHFAASMLNIKSRKDILIEKRCLRKLLAEAKEGNSISRKILRYLYYLLRKYEKLIEEGQARNLSIQHDEALISAKLDSNSMTNSGGHDFLTGQVRNVLGSTLPGKFIGTSFYGSLETSSNSIHSNTSSMKDFDLGIDASNLSLGSSDNSFGNTPRIGHEYGLGSIQDSFDVEPHQFQFYTNIEDIRTQFLSNVRELPWESQVAAIHDVNAYLIDYNPSCSLVSSENFLDPLISFFQEALDKHDREAQKAGSQLFITFLQASRRKPEDITEKLYPLLASWLATEAAGETLAIVEALSTEVPFLNYAASSSLLASIFKILDSEKTDFQTSALKVLNKCSLQFDNSSCKLASDWIIMLVPFLDNELIAGTCLDILKNLYKFEEIQLSADTQDLIAQIIKLLDTFNHEEQEQATDILLSLCTQYDHYCLLVLGECGIPALVNASNNGSEKGKASALELLQKLRETKLPENVQESPRSNDETSEDRPVENSDQKYSKTSGLKKWLFRKK